MREIISVQVGQCGNQIGGKFWETICAEHGIGADGVYKGDNAQQLERADVYFTEVDAKRWVPRAVLVDLGTSLLPDTRSSWDYKYQWISRGCLLLRGISS